MAKQKIEDSIDIPVENQGSDDVELFENLIKKALKGEILGEVCEPEGYGTGSIALDAALTVPIPKGFIIEIFADNGVGKTTLALEVLGQGQLKNCRVGYLDMEGTLNKSLVKSIRTLDTEKVDSRGHPLWIYKEGLIKDKETGQTRMLSGEEAFRYIENFAGMFKNAYLVVDSVDSLVPSAIIEKEIGENTMGQLGKLMSDGMRKLHALCKMNNTTVIFINQVRDNPGQMFGCFTEKTPIAFADGSFHSIKEVIDNKMVGPVLTKNLKTNNIEPKSIKNWFKNGQTERKNWINIKAENNGGRNGRFSLTITPNHKIFVYRNKQQIEISASELLKTDKLISWYDSALDNEYISNIFIGSMLGDGHLTKTNNCNGSFVLQNSEQPDYLQWKLDKLSSLYFRKYKTINNKYRYCSEFSREFGLIHDKWYIEGLRSKIYPNDLELNDLICAVWYMDDGSFSEGKDGCSISIKRFYSIDNIEYGQELIQGLIKKLEKYLNIPQGYVVPHGTSLYFNKVAFHIFMKKICTHIIPCMQYKLPKEYHSKYIDFSTTSMLTKKEHLVSILEIKNLKGNKNLSKYDIEVEDNNNYYVGNAGAGVLVHNSPEVTPGGKALKFYAACRLRLSKPSAKVIKDKDNNIIGHVVNVTIVKNKVPTVSSNTEFTIMYGSGIDRESEIASLGVQLGIIKNFVDDKGNVSKRLLDVAGNKVEPSQLRDFFLANSKIAAEYLQKIKDAI